ncbi:carbohydrate-binding family 9-like protein [Mucilaginibacter sp. UR6-11]|uniref:carbohydrate-binding family 9-like protein n=1 Tax=Mucilaginibacter sp. UR6-11 TaxID=1435644 RepID=UPI001E286A73|nr:carbohydrate-binding family 9-like protein [Mucilaginibacter sp. UR6-11]MCC8423689.1 hypothetical protein [Mucilaginibacter sp. UR6-11]
MTKQFDCQFIPVEKLAESVELLLNNSPQQAIDNLLWSDNGYFPRVVFSMAYTDHSLLLKYFVKEKYAIARHTRVNDLVYKDSCVEFFVSFDNGINYYNLEFNCIGTPYAAYGPDKFNRVELPVDEVKRIKVSTQMNNVGKEGISEWEITLDIPFGVFVYHNITSLRDAECKANFYKCGDETPDPHYLSWNNILSTEPNFHAPEYFGTVNFI